MQDESRFLAELPPPDEHATLDDMLRANLNENTSGLNVHNNHLRADRTNAQ